MTTHLKHAQGWLEAACGDLPDGRLAYDPAGTNCMDCLVAERERLPAELVALRTREQELLCRYADVVVRLLALERRNASSKNS